MLFSLLFLISRRFESLHRKKDINNNLKWLKPQYGVHVLHGLIWLRRITNRRSHVISLANFIPCCVIYLFIHLSVGTPNADRRTTFWAQSSNQSKRDRMHKHLSEIPRTCCTYSMGTCHYTFLIINSLSQENTLQCNNFERERARWMCYHHIDYNSNDEEKRKKHSHAHTREWFWNARR